MCIRTFNHGLKLSFQNICIGLPALLIVIVSACAVKSESEPGLSQRQNEPKITKDGNGNVKQLQSESNAREQKSIPASSQGTTLGHTLPVNVTIVGNARDRQFVSGAMDDVAEIYAQCNISLNLKVNEAEDKNAIDINVSERYALTSRYARTDTQTRVWPSVFIVNSTAERDVAFSYLPSLERDVAGTAWISDRASEACFAWIVAHEMGHIILDSGVHHTDTRNVMNARCSNNNNFNRSSTPPHWSDTQCAVMRANTTRAFSQ